LNPDSNAHRALSAAHKALDSLLKDAPCVAAIDKVTTLLADRFAAGNKVLICGNGGSSCDAMHFAEELTGRFRKDRRPLPAISCSDVGHITCTANDYGFDVVFSRWVEALGQRGDILILLSTSGNSQNIINAARVGKSRGLSTISLLGKDGGKLKGLCDIELIVPGDGSDRIQELHMLILHTLVEGVESIMFSK
jgi:D-sedoheptulose 7-phosphate isomerase